MYILIKSGWKWSDLATLVPEHPAVFLSLHHANWSAIFNNKSQRPLKDTCIYTEVKLHKSIFSLLGHFWFITLFFVKKKNKLKYSHFITMHCFSYITKKPNTTSQHMGLFKKFKIYNYLCKAVKRSLHPHYNDSHLLSMTCASKTLEIFPNQIQTENASSL